MNITLWGHDYCLHIITTKCTFNTIQNVKTLVCQRTNVCVCLVPMEGQMELCSFDDSLSICKGASHAAEDPLMNLNHLVDGFR